MSAARSLQREADRIEAAARDHPASTAVTDERACSVGRTINILSDAWAFLILREAFFGARTFQAFRTALGIPRATLTDRLATLTARGIFRKVAAAPGSRRQDYRLTRIGFDLYPSFIALMQFGDRWLAGDKGPPLKLRHRACGCECRPYVACSSCLGEVAAEAVSYRDGPGAGRQPSTPGRSTRRSSDRAKFVVGRPSSVSRALEVIGDRWSFMVVREAFFGVRRYDQFQDSLGIAPNILTDRLNRFVENGIFLKRLYTDRPPRSEYVLSRMGRDLYGPFLVMLSWGDRWLCENGPPLILTHTACGHDFDPLVVCNHCRGEITADSMDYATTYRLP